MYQRSKEWEENIYNNPICAMNIYIDDVLVNPDYILDFKKGGNAFEEEFCLGGTPSQYVEMKLYKDKMPESLKKIRVEYGILINHALTVAEVNAMLVGTLNGIPVKSLSSNDSSFEMIPIGIYNVDDYTDNDDNTITIKALDNMIKFEFNYDGSELISKGEATLLEVAQDICKKAGVELNSTSFLNSDKKVAVYDNTVTAREYISYIAESAEGFACIDRKGKLCFRKFYQDETEIPLEMFGEYKWGEEFKISKVSYEDGIRSFKFGDDTRNNLWINQENMYIVDEDQVQKIYNEIKDLTANTFEGKTVIDPAIDLGDKIVIDGKNVIYQGEMSLEGSFIAQISSKIQIKQKEETTVKKESQKVVNRKVQSRIDQAEGKIEQLVEETSEQSKKLTKVEQTVDSISQKVSDIEDLTQTTEGIKTVALANCIEGNLLELHIYGNNTIFDYITLDDELVLSDDLYLQGDSLITVTDKDGNKTEYELNVQEPLRQNSEVCDEFILENGQAKVIRRVNKSGSTKAKESVETLGKLEIPLKEGTNTIAINNYTARIKVKYVIKSAYSDTFASRVEMNSAITQNSEKIMSEVNKKVDENELGTKIEQNAEAVKFAWNQISEFIQMMIINGNASLAILDKNKKVLMALDKVGQHFYNSDKTMDIGAFDCYFPSYDTTYKSLMFALNEKATNNFMAWGYKITAENEDTTYTPVVYLGGNSDEDYGFHVENDIILNFNKIRLKKSKIYDNNDSLCFEIGEDLFYGDTRDNKEIFSVYNNSTGTKTFRFFGDDSNPIMIDSSGNLALANGKIILDNNGNIDCVHLYQTGDSSDIRIKNNIKDSSESAINIINKIHHKEFDKKDDNTHYKIGYIAQEMEQIDKNFVVKKHADKEKGVEERYYINQLPILATVTKAIQEQQAQIEELKKEIETLKGAKE